MYLYNQEVKYLNRNYDLAVSKKKKVHKPRREQFNVGTIFFLRFPFESCDPRSMLCLQVKPDHGVTTRC